MSTDVAVVSTEAIGGDVDALEVWSKSLVVRTPLEKELAVDSLRQIKAKKSFIVGFFKDSKEKAHSAWKAIVGNEKSLTDRLDAAEGLAKNAILKYDRAEEEKRLAEQRRLQAIADEAARKERVAAELAAAKQRAIEDEARRVAEEKRRKALEATDAERKRLLAEAGAAERKAEAAAAKAEAKDDIAEAAVAPVIRVAEPEKTKGFAQRDNWKARVINADIVPRDWLIPDIEGLNKYAKAIKGGRTVPGVEFYNEPIAAVGGRV